MKTAFAAWENRIAPVFDVARQIHIIETEVGQGIRESQVLLTDDLPVQRALRLAELGVSTLVCGAISRPMHEMVVAYGVQVIPFVAGDLREVIQAWLKDGLQRNPFAMPGCWRRGRRRHGGMRGIYKEVQVMNGGKSGGSGRGGGGGQGMWPGQGGVGGGGRGGSPGGGGGGGGRGAGQGAGGQGRRGRGGGGAGGLGGGQGGRGGGLGGGGRRQRPGGQRLGRMGGPLAGGPGGYCVCPQCGHRESHKRGVPCAQTECPKCGIPMTRER